MNAKNIFSLITLSSLSIFIFYLSGIIGILEFFLSLIVYSLIFYWFYFLWKKLRKKQICPYKNYLIYFLQKVSFALVFVFGLLGGGSYYYNEISPAAMPTYTLSNGKKTVIFQAMSHIGTQNFYTQIIQDITKAKHEGYVYFFEGVRPGTPENTQKFNQAIGIKFDKDLYKNFSKLYGVEHQDNQKFLGLVNNKDYNIDLSIDDIIELYEIKNPLENNYSIAPLDANQQIIETLSRLNERQLKILVYINQAILNFIIQSETTQTLLTQNFTNKQLFEIILDKRNEVLAREIIQSEENNIYLTYGLLHFKGVLEILQQNDPNWRIIDTKYLYPIQ